MSRPHQPGQDPARRALRAFGEICAGAADGDLEPRLAALDADPDVATARRQVNRLLDVVDAYVRESSAAISSASHGDFHRRLLQGGLHGAFRAGARTIDDGRAAMQDSAGKVEEASRAREQLAADLESTVLQVSEQVAAAATEMGATAEGVVSFARDAVDDSTRATDTVESLRASSEEIRRAVDLISKVASQTRMLALNATIEAARAGEAGQGFSVVASEVKTMADEAAGSSKAITERVGAVQEAAAEAILALEGVTGRIREMDRMVNDIAAAVEGAPGSGSGGLVHLAEMLRSEVTRFVRDVRGG